MSIVEPNCLHHIYKARPFKLVLSEASVQRICLYHHFPIDGIYWMHIKYLYGWRKGSDNWFKCTPSANKSCFYEYRVSESEVPKRVLDMYEVDKLLES